MKMSTQKFSRQIAMNQQNAIYRSIELSLFYQKNSHLFGRKLLTGFLLRRNMNFTRFPFIVSVFFKGGVRTRLFVRRMNEAHSFCLCHFYRFFDDFHIFCKKIHLASIKISEHARISIYNGISCFKL